MAVEQQQQQQTGGGENTLDKETATQLKDAIAGLNTGLAKLMTEAQKTQQQQQQQQQQPPAAEGAEEEEETGPDDEELEKLNRRQFADFMVKTMAKRMDVPLAELKAAIQSVGQESRTATLTQVATKFAEEHDDFPEWEQEMVAIARANPSLPINRIYTLARAENPEKVKEIDKKLKAAREAKAKEKGEEPPPPTKKPPVRASNGLSPSGTGGEKPNQKMNAKDAADAAWDEAVAAFGNPFSATQ